MATDSPEVRFRAETRCTCGADSKTATAEAEELDDEEARDSAAAVPVGLRIDLRVDRGADAGADTGTEVGAEADADARAAGTIGAATDSISLLYGGMAKRGNWRDSAIRLEMTGNGHAAGAFSLARATAAGESTGSASHGRAPAQTFHTAKLRQYAHDRGYYGPRRVREKRELYQRALQSTIKTMRHPIPERLDVVRVGLLEVKVRHKGCAHDISFESGEHMQLLDRRLKEQRARIACERGGAFRIATLDVGERIVQL